MNVNPMTLLTTVKILKGVPLDSTYTDTLDFSSVSEQASFFSSKTKFNIPNMSPIRLQNKIRLDINADKLYDCNYIMFQNSNFSNKWFYAFIKSIDFINVNRSDIEFEIDVLQTWMFDYTIKPSFVEREHIADDTIGNNLVAENLELGEYVSNAEFGSGLMDDSVIVIASTLDLTTMNLDRSKGVKYLGVYSGVKYFVSETVEGVNASIDWLDSKGKTDAIISIFMMPKRLVADENTTHSEHEIEINFPKNYTTLDGYTPKNNKLYTHPYNFLYCYNTIGATAEFKYEFFKRDTCPFSVWSDMSCNPQVLLIPNSYKTQSTTGNNTNEKMVLEGFPQCTYNSDVYKVWLAQNSSSLAVSTLSTALGGVTSGMAGNPTGVAGATIGIASQLASIQKSSMQPPQAKGNTGNSAMFSYGDFDFNFMKASITHQYAKIIDDYFSMYGYATHDVKVPNTTGRPSWNYVKTIDVKIVGSVPFGDMDIIKSVYNNGVTIWHGDWVGDYSRNNK